MCTNRKKNQNEQGDENSKKITQRITIYGVQKRQVVARVLARD